MTWIDVTPKRKADKKHAKEVEAILNDGPMLKAILAAIGDLWADQIVFGAHQKPSEYLKQHLPKPGMEGQ